MDGWDIPDEFGAVCEGSPGECFSEAVGSISGVLETVGESLDGVGTTVHLYRVGGWVGGWDVLSSARLGRCCVVLLLRGPGLQTLGCSGRAWEGGWVGGWLSCFLLLLLLRLDRRKRKKTILLLLLLLLLLRGRGLR